MEDPRQDSCLHTKDDMTTATCTNISTQYADVGVPIKLKPYAIVGNVETECTGDPVISLRSGQNTNCCYGCGRGCGCEITIMQTVCIKIPVTYGTIADVGETTVNCKRPPNR